LTGETSAPHGKRMKSLYVISLIEASRICFEGCELGVSEFGDKVFDSWGSCWYPKHRIMEVRCGCGVHFWLGGE
jgi:hypothetical protein